MPKKLNAMREVRSRVTSRMPKKLNAMREVRSKVTSRNLEIGIV
jgi:hypothetical protein